MHRNVSQIVLGVAVAGLASGVGGCWGPKKVDVTGRVNYNGAPLPKPGGQIVFVDADGTQVAASIGQDGAYRAPKVNIGLQHVAVYYPNPEFQTAKRSPVKPKKGEPPPPPLPPAPPAFLTPIKYASIDTSNLSVQVAEGTVFDADLTGPAIP